MPTLLFVCNDHIGPAMAGPGIRTWELARALRNRGYQVVILTRLLEPGFSSEALTFLGTTSLKNLVLWIGRADAVILPGSPLPIILAVLFRKKLYFDQYDPVIFEFLSSRPSNLAGRIRKTVMLALWRIRQRIIVRFGEGYFVANEKQKDLLIGQLALSGRTKKLESITVLPFGLPDEQPVSKRPMLRGTKIRESDFLLLWGGGIWDWFDPFTLLRALAKIRLQRDDIKVYFPGIKPPSPDSRKMTVVDRFLQEAKSLGLLDSTVFVNEGWTPYEQRADYLLEADAGISLHNDSMETRFAFRTRMLDYLWAGLPVIASQGDSWSDQIERNGLGISIPCNDVDAATGAIIKMADDTEFRRKCAERVQAVALQYRWDNLVKSMRL